MVGGLTALGLIIRSVAGRASLRLAEVPATRLTALTVTSAAAGAGLGGGLHEAVGVLMAFAAGTGTFLAASRATGGLLPAAHIEARLTVLPRGRRLAARGAALVTRPPPSLDDAPRSEPRLTAPLLGRTARSAP